MPQKYHYNDMINSKTSPSQHIRWTVIDGVLVREWVLPDPVPEEKPRELFSILQNIQSGLTNADTAELFRRAEDIPEEIAKLKAMYPANPSYWDGVERMANVIIAQPAVRAEEEAKQAEKLKQAQASMATLRNTGDIISFPGCGHEMRRRGNNIDYITSLVRNNPKVKAIGCPVCGKDADINLVKKLLR